MLLMAKVVLNAEKAKIVNQTSVNIQIFNDNVENTPKSISEFVNTELEAMFGISFIEDVDYVITNMNELLDDLSLTKNYED